MIKALIIDDESKGIEILKVLIKNHCPVVNIVGWAEEVDEGIELINSLQPDLIFLDIEMSGETGFDLLSRVKPYKFQVIFVTAHGEYAVRAFRYSVSDYLLKPVDIHELKEAVNKVYRIMHEEPQENGALNHNGSNLTLKIPFHQRAVFVKMADIIRIEADGAYTKIYLTDHRHYVVSYNIKVVEDLLDMQLFTRIHRSHVININKVSSLSDDGRVVLMCDGTSIKIARRERNEFISRIDEKIK
jgi:two-component system, LytTR family, response regulator